MKTSVAILAACAALAAGLAVAQARPARPEAPKLVTLGHLNPTPGTYSADVFWHRGYAYLSSYRLRAGCPARGVGVVDLRNARRPRAVARFARVPGTWTEKTIVRHVQTPSFTGDLAVTSLQACTQTAFRGFALTDVTRPAQPRQLALVRTEPRGSHEIWLATSGRRAFVYTAIIRSEILSSPDYDADRNTATIPGEPDFRIFEVTDPVQPQQVGSWGAWKHLGIHPNDGVGPGALNANLVHSVVTNRAGTRAFLSYWDLGTVILDVSRPEEPRYLGRTTFEAGEAGNAHSVALNADETILIESHETEGGTATLWNVSKPTAPVRLSEVTLSDALLRQGRRGQDTDRLGGFDIADSVHDPKIRGRYAYFSWYRQGVVVADISNPRRPRVVARFLAPSAADPDRLVCPDRSCRAVWGVFVTPQHVLASDMLSGLWVLRLGS
jgi:hypothetical protein